MIKLKYMGDKPFISPFGIRFISGRPDKYIYIPSAVKLYLLLKDEKNWHNNHLEYEFPKSMMNDNEMLGAITKKDEKLIKKTEEFIKNYQKRLDDFILSIKDDSNYSEREKESFVKNLEFIKPYRIQRATNKALYHILINDIAKIITQKEILSIY